MDQSTKMSKKRKLPLGKVNDIRTVKRITLQNLLSSFFDAFNLDRGLT